MNYRLKRCCATLPLAPRMPSGLPSENCSIASRPRSAKTISPTAVMNPCRSKMLQRRAAQSCCHRDSLLLVRIKGPVDLTSQMRCVSTCAKRPLSLPRRSHPYINRPIGAESISKLPISKLPICKVLHGRLGFVCRRTYPDQIGRLVPRPRRCGRRSDQKEAAVLRHPVFCHKRMESRQLNCGSHLRR